MRYLRKIYLYMENEILVAGATGNLGSKIVAELIKNGAKVSAIVRKDTTHDRVAALEKMGAKVYPVDMSIQSEVAKICIGKSCVVSALSGLKETIIDTQLVLLKAAVEAKVPRFIPSDFSIDFTNLIDGNNRNLDLRRSFHTYLDKEPIQATTIFNGAFMELLTGDMPLIMADKKRILHWGSPEQVMDFTTTFNVAAYTAKAALDPNAPRYLRIAGGTTSAKDLVTLMGSISGNSFKLFRPGGIGLLNIIIKMVKFFTPRSNELYPVWQGMQYMRDMMGGRVNVANHDNGRYAGIDWTNIEAYMRENTEGGNLT
jgi:NAD(P)-dependent dehydrogenase (short-subunit alcohol dehydrogenase family)